MHHGAALVQIARSQRLTGINSVKLSTGYSENAYQINTDIAVYIKYATKPSSPYDEYTFTFTGSLLSAV
jgi:hypothetical protein